jgi:O-antigen ligase
MNLGIRWLSSVWNPLHNPVLVIWAETGLPGLVLYLAVLASAVISFLRQYLQSRRIGAQYLIPYYAVVASVFLGYMASWIKGGGLEVDFSYFLMLALLLIPSYMQTESSQRTN